VISKKWKKGDKVEVNLPMDVQRVIANDKLPEDAVKLPCSAARMMYCAEWKDNDGKAANIIIPKNTAFTTQYEPELLNGVTILKAEVKAGQCRYRLNKP
jgi:DUF1680 family protein